MNLNPEFVLLKKISRKPLLLGVTLRQILAELSKATYFYSFKNTYVGIWRQILYLHKAESSDGKKSGVNGTSHYVKNADTKEAHHKNEVHLPTESSQLVWINC